MRLPVYANVSLFCFLAKRYPFAAFGAHVYVEGYFGAAAFVTKHGLFFLLLWWLMWIHRAVVALVGGRVKQYLFACRMAYSGIAEGYRFAA